MTDLERCGFFNSSGGDRRYDAGDFAAHFARLLSTGVFWANTASLRVDAGAGMTVLLQPGAAWLNGYVYENTAALTLPLATADGVYPRVDRVVLRWSAVERRIAAAVLTGVATASPAPPSLTRGAEVFELVLADVAVGAGAIRLAAGNVTDRRLDAGLCGIAQVCGAVDDGEW